MSPTTAMAVTMSPPPPRPWTIRKRDQLRQILRKSAQSRADEEDDDGDLQHNAATVDIAELTVERHHDGGSKEIGGDDPGKMRQAADLADDGRQRRRHDCLVERGEQQDKDKGGEDGKAVAWAG